MVKEWWKSGGGVVKEWWTNLPSKAGYLLTEFSKPSNRTLPVFVRCVCLGE